MSFTFKPNPTRQRSAQCTQIAVLLIVWLLSVFDPVQAQNFCPDDVGSGCDNCPNYSVTDNPPLTGTCEETLRMVILIDESNSISGNEDDVEDGVMAFLEELECTPVEVAIIEFGSIARYVITSFSPVASITAGMQDYFDGTATNSAPFNNQIYTIPPDGDIQLGGTNWQAALYLADQLPVSDLLLFFTDGNPTAWTPDLSMVGSSYDFCTAGNTTEEAEMYNAVQLSNKIKSEGTHMFVLAVGGGLNINNVEDISGPTEYDPNGVGDETMLATADYFQEHNFDDLQECLEHFAQNLCPVIDPVCNSTNACNGNDGTITIDFANDVDPPYVYSINGGTPMMSNTEPIVIMGLTPGSYTIDVMGGTGCIREGTCMADVGGPDDCCMRSAECALNDIDEEGCHIPPAFTDPGDVFDNIESCGAYVTMDHMDMGDTEVCTDGDGANFTRTYKLYFNGQLFKTCVQKIMIDDTTPPLIICPPDIPIECGNDTSPNATGMAVATDNCGPVTITFDDDFDPACGDSGTITRTWKATDRCGTMATCDQIITIVDTTPPTIDCPSDRTVECGDDTSPNSTGTATGSDNCGPVTITFDDDFDPACGDSGTITRTWKATDRCGLMTTCEQIITILDRTPPQIDCPPTATVNCNDSTNPNITGMATGSDNCGPVTITFSDQTDGGCGSTGTITRTWKATDRCGLMATCDQIIIVIDNTPPMINCPNDRTVECGTDTSPNTTGMATGSDDCGPVDITFSDSFQSDCPQSTNANGTGTITRTWKATNACGLMATCVQIITIVDTTPPVISTPPGSLDETIVLTNPNLCPDGFLQATCYFSSNPNFPLSVDITIDGVFLGNFPGPPIGDIADNCELGLVSCFFDNFIPGPCVTTFDVVWVAQDVCGVNFSDPFVQSFTIEDGVPPEFDPSCALDLIFTTSTGGVCPEDADISLEEGDIIGIDDGWTVGGESIPSLDGCVSDNCVDDEDLDIIVDDITITGDECERVISVTFIADDGCGNLSAPFTCTYTFIDDTPPVVNLNGLPDGSTITAECNLRDPNWDPFPALSDLTIFDDCTDVDVQMEEELIAEGECGVDDFKSIWRCTWTVNDACDNETVYSLFIRIVDTQGPEWTFFPPDVGIHCDDEIPFQQARAQDNCSEVDVRFNDTVIPGDCPGNYTIRRRWTAVDGCGNPTVDDQMITVTDDTPPNILLIDEYVSAYEDGQEIYTDCGEFSAITKLRYAARAFDNCSGEVLVEFSYEDFGGFDCAEYGYMGHLVTRWTADDGCGNSSTVTLYWFLTDTTPPVLHGVPEDDCVDELPPVPFVTSVDDCEFAVVSFRQSDPIDCDGGQYVERTWTATDVCGNTASATQRLTLGSGDGPSISIDYPGLEGLPSGSTASLGADCEDGELSVPDLASAVSIDGGCSGSNATANLILLDEGDCTTNGYLARYQLSVTARDICGNMSNYELFVELTDNIPPVMSGQAEIVVGCGEGIPEISAVDACSDMVNIGFEDTDPIEPSCPDAPRNFERVWRATDACGNTSVFAQSITILDTEGPELRNVPADACDDTTLDGPVTAFDHCSGEMVTVNMTESTENVSGCGEVLTRTWTATDACGNTSSATQQVFFSDEQPPSLAFTHPLLVTLNDGDELILPVDFTFGNPQEPYDFGDEAVRVDDNCASSLSPEVEVQVMPAEDCAAYGYLARVRYTWTATDPCGNAGKISIIVLYEDTYGPEIFYVPENLRIYCDDGVPPPADVFVKDNYDQHLVAVFREVYVDTPEGVRIIRTWTATDQCGNTTVATQYIDIIDNNLDCEFEYFPEEPDCNSANNQIGVLVSGGTPPYTYNWAMVDCDGFITSDPTQPNVFYTIGYTTQNFSVTITDANGCQRVCTTSVECDKEDEEENGEIEVLLGGLSPLIDLNIYPNPVDAQLIVAAPKWEEGMVSVRIFSLLGQQMYVQRVNHGLAEGLRIATQAYPEGTYVIRIDMEGQEPVFEQIVIQHR